MTTKPTTYIYSDAECVLGSYTPPVLPDEPMWNDSYETENGSERFQSEMDEWREECDRLIEQAKKTAVRFADQDFVDDVITLKYKKTKREPNTIYTVEGYEASLADCGNEFEECECSAEHKHCIYQNGATLKRIEPVLESVEQERYPMGKDQPAQIDCRVESCVFYKGAGTCSNLSPAITLNKNGHFVCWSNKQSNPPKQ